MCISARVAAASCQSPLSSCSLRSCTSAAVRTPLSKSSLARCNSFTTSLAVRRRFAGGTAGAGVAASAGARGAAGAGALAARTPSI